MGGDVAEVFVEPEEIKRRVRRAKREERGTDDRYLNVSFEPRPRARGPTHSQAHARQRFSGHRINRGAWVPTPSDALDGQEVDLERELVAAAQRRCARHGALAAVLGVADVGVDASGRERRVW